MNNEKLCFEILVGVATPVSFNNGFINAVIYNNPFYIRDYCWLYVAFSYCFSSCFMGNSFIKQAMAKVPFINYNVSPYRLYIMAPINNGGYDRTRWIWKTTSNS